MPPITIKHLAKLLNISISTVSRALNDSHEIGLETRRKVQELAKELNYQPNPSASNLRTRKSRTIAVIIPEITNSFFALAIDGIEEIAQQAGYHVLIHITHDNPGKEAGIVRHLLNGRVDGVLMSLASRTQDTAHIDLFREMKIPLVFFDRVCESFATCKVMTDDFNSGFRAVTHLAENGCSSVAYLSLSQNLSIDQKRRDGYLAACADLGLHPLVIHCSQNEGENKEMIRELLNRSPRPDGIFASVEKLALTVYEICGELGVIIPSEVKVIGFSNLKMAALMHPPLTTITQPAFEIGREAANALCEALKNNRLQEAEEIIIPSTLVARRSTERE